MTLRGQIDDFSHWTPSCQLQPATTLKVGNPSPSNWQHRYLKVSSLQKSKLQPWGICINYKTPHSLMIKWYCGGMVRRPLRNLPVCSTLHCAELGHSLQPVPRCSTHTPPVTLTHTCPLNLNRKPYTLFPTLLPYFLSLSLSKCGNGIAHWALGLSSSSYPISLEGKWDFEVVRFSVHYYYYPISLEGNGILKLYDLVYTIIIIIRVVRQWWYLCHFASYLIETWWAHGPWA